MNFDQDLWGDLRVSVSRTEAPVAVLMGIHGRASAPELVQERAVQLGDRYLHVLPRGPLDEAPGASWYFKTDERGRLLAESRTKLLALVTEIRTRTGFGPEAIGVWGFSQGATMALEVGLHFPSALAATVAVSGLWDGPSRDSAVVMARARGRRFFLAHGVRDEVVSPECSREAFRALTQAGAKVELAEISMGHDFGPIPIAAARGYLASLLNPNAS